MNATLAVPHAQLPSVRFRRRAALTILSSAAIAGALVYMNADPFAFVRDFHFVTNLVGQMLPPDLSLFWHKKSLLPSLIDTISMAFLATLVGATVAFVLALLAARNTTPYRSARLVIRSLLALERCTPEFVVLMVLLISVGIGPFAAMLTILLRSIGMFGKLFADAIEHIDAGPLEATAVTGAGRLQIIRYAVLPQVAPSIVANVFYAFDVNLRMAVALGVFGGGGIGFELNLARGVLRYRDMFACLLLVIVMINLMERVADAFRKRIFSLEAQLE